MAKNRLAEALPLAGDMGRVTQMFMLATQYGGPLAPLSKCADLFGLTPDEAAKRASRAALPVPAFRCGSQRSPWLINVEDLADFLAKQRTLATSEWSKVNAA